MKKFKSDIEIARNSKLKPISKIVLEITPGGKETKAQGLQYRVEMRPGTEQ